MARPNNKWSVSLVTWGKPSDPRTFSGYSRSLADELRNCGRLRREYSLKLLRTRDVFSGAISPVRRNGHYRLAVSGKWLWSRRGHEAISDRVTQSIQRTGDQGSVLQIGTAARIGSEVGLRYLLTDMTIPQAHRAGEFGFQYFNAAELREAVAIQRQVVAEAEHIFALTQWAADSIVHDLGAAPERVTPVYVGPMLQYNGGNYIHRRPFRILFVGMDWKRKGGPELVEGFRVLRRRVPQAELAIIGCSPKVNEPGVEVFGFLDPRSPRQRERVRQQYQRASCLALMSDLEPLGFVMVEAFGAGLPVVAYDAGSRREIIRDGVDGILCRDRSPSTIADALEFVLCDQDRLETMRANALSAANHRFTWARVIAAIGTVVSQPGITATKLSGASSESVKRVNAPPSIRKGSQAPVVG